MRTAHEISAILQKLRGLYLDTPRDATFSTHFERLLTRDEAGKLTREAARQDVFDYIEMFYNPKRKHTNNGMMSPVDFEARQKILNEAGV